MKQHRTTIGSLFAITLAASIAIAVSLIYIRSAAAIRESTMAGKLDK